MNDRVIDWEFPYASQRMPVCAGNIVVTSQPLAAQAGLSMLYKGGNAVDAAVAAAISLVVAEPTGNGVGSDAFAIVWDGGKLHGLNGSGRSPDGWNHEKFSHLDAMPQYGWDSVTVPGAVSTWVELSNRFGKMPFQALFEPALKQASDGFPVSPIIAKAWNRAAQIYGNFAEFNKTFLPSGRPPEPGELFSYEDLARTLKEIAVTNGDSFYRGKLAEKIAAHAQSGNGSLTIDDLASHQPDWVDTITYDYRGYTLHEIPPNGQGLAALIALGILGNFDISTYVPDSADSIHLQIEAMKLAFADVGMHLADPEFMKVGVDDFLDKNYLASRAGLIDMKKVKAYRSAMPEGGGTVYLTAADSEGMMVSFIQSNYYGFGSGVVIPKTGISLQNRGFGFTLEKDHPNRVDGGKRPYHTIIPAFVMKDNSPVMSFGVMGGHFQPQGHLQMMVRIFDYHQNPQAAADAPRWCLMEDMRIAVEPGFSADVLNDLSVRGHEIITDVPTSQFGGAQLIFKLDDCYIGASDHRKDGMAVGY